MHKKWIIFGYADTCSLAVTERFNICEPNEQKLSENVVAEVQNRPVFSIIAFHKTSKKQRCQPLSG